VPVLAEDLDRPTRWPVLDGFRGLAVLAVVGYHAVKLVLEAHGRVAADPMPWTQWPLGIGRFSVDAFFVLSGFLIVTAWDRRPELRRFFARRVRRIWPAYLATVVVLVPLLAPEVLDSAWDLLLLVTLQGHLSPGLTQSVNVPWWSLTTEVQFYVLVPVLAPLLHRRFLRWVLLAGACALSAWWWALAAEETALSGSLLPGRLPQFLVGALVGIAIRERAADVLTWSLAASRWIGRVAVGGIVALGLYLGANGTYHRRDVAFDLWIEPLSAVCLGLLLLHLVVRAEQGQRTLLDARPLRLAGLTSYSLYLWHFPILVAAVSWIDVTRSPSDAVLAVTLGLAASVAVSLVSYRLVERPALHGRRRPREPEPQPRLVTARS
jgi:peptidoglycan/LPS O-acetylase OafA/YrhL